MTLCKRGHSRISSNLYKNDECKTCHNDYQKTEKCKENKRNYVRSEKGKAYQYNLERRIEYRFGIGVRNAKRRNIVWEITFERYLEVIKNPCAYCENPLPETGNSLDRLDSNLGYNFYNVVACCGNCNKHKSNDWTFEEMRAAIRAVKTTRNVILLSA